jgi:hypothetical protein
MFCTYCASFTDLRRVHFARSHFFPPVFISLLDPGPRPSVRSLTSPLPALTVAPYTILHTTPVHILPSPQSLSHYQPLY